MGQSVTVLLLRILGEPKEHQDSRQGHYSGPLQRVQYITSG